MPGIQDIKNSLSRGYDALPKLHTVALGIGLAALVAGIVMSAVSIEVLKQIGSDCPAQGMCSVIEKTGIGMGIGGLFVSALGFKLHSLENRAKKEQIKEAGEPRQPPMRQHPMPMPPPTASAP